MLFGLLYFPGAALSTEKIEFYSESEEKIFRNINFYLSLLKGHDASCSEEKVARTDSSLRECSASTS